MYSVLNSARKDLRSHSSTDLHKKIASSSNAYGYEDMRRGSLPSAQPAGCIGSGRSRQRGRSLCGDHLGCGDRVGLADAVLVYDMETRLTRMRRPSGCGEEKRSLHFYGVALTAYQKWHGSTAAWNGLRLRRHRRGHSTGGCISLRSTRRRGDAVRGAIGRQHRHSGHAPRRLDSV